METKNLFPDDFFKQFKTGEELQNFQKDLQKRGIEKMLEGEFDAPQLPHERKFDKVNP